jgi:hypothetical protein
MKLGIFGINKQMMPDFLDKNQPVAPGRNIPVLFAPETGGTPLGSCRRGLLFRFRIRLSKEICQRNRVPGIPPFFKKPPKIEKKMLKHR